MENLPELPVDDQWLNELDELLPIETIASSAPFQANFRPPAPSRALEAPPNSASSQDGDEELVLESKMQDRRQAYRQKKRRELLELRGLSANLQAQLHELLQRRKALASTAGGSKRLVAGWRGVALRQMQRRMAAEALNRELRTQIRSRHEASVSLMELLRAQMAAERSARAVKLVYGEQSKPVMQLSERDVWDMSLLLRDIDDMCATVLPQIQNAEMPLLKDSKTYDSRFSRDFGEANGVHSATFAETILLPFPAAEAIPAMDTAFPEMFGGECVPAISDVTEDGSTTAVKFLWKRFEILFVTKGIEDSEHLDIAWRSIIRERGQPSGPTIEEYGWGRAVAAESSSSSTQFHYLSHWRAKQPHSSENALVVPNVNPLDLYTQLHIASSESDMLEFAQTIENVIMDDMVARKQSAINVSE